MKTGMNNITIELTAEQWTTVMSWYDYKEQIADNSDEDDIVVNIIAAEFYRQIRINE